MADPRFFKVSAPKTLRELAQIAKAEVYGTDDLDRAFCDVAPLTSGGETDVSFLLSKKYWNDFLASKSGVCIIHKDLKDQVPQGRVVLLANEPYQSYGWIAGAFYPNETREKTIIDPSAHVAASAVVGEGSRIDAGAVVGENVVLGKNARVYPNAVIGDGVVMGDDCIVGANASVLNCLAGSKVYIYPGARIGQDGFGFYMSAQGHTKIAQLGRVIIGNDVEIGANTCVDRGALGDTVIGDGSRLDNLIQVGHNVHTGRCCVLVAQVGVAGSTELGDFVVMGGQSGSAGHIKIGSGAKIAGQSGVMRDVAPMEEMMGSPAMPAKEFMRQFATLKKAVKMFADLNKTKNPLSLLAKLKGKK